ncbi:vacuolar ATP synthase subunit S1-domain-containing protein [Phycomyces blakesleeanus]|uniref:Protein BIG1 n=2 Tax=Phycomyces blakesleeanus TaxID=4837 RepID=A0A167QM62_PHYB8|nr:hypothetical protein PHYBLDRAFT_75715 [Phycomyces blakesleeanus NRRL 1555(-)]OAD79911.1 hypothetical protein PHYBLDRAFT_75715 [Phycomyces blakesleeanus NRRL 1555(-)]|eukprot:XP_018297951.1 hypothetical protein PHYBLDRAFT_75715 [Phycomyces blakesleeanus NRRL 1555(-)]
MKLYAAILSLASAVVAFESTVPCLMWSPKNYLQPSLTNTEQLYLGTELAVSSIFASLSPNVCNAKVVAVINQPELHRSDLSRSDYTESFEHLKEHVSSAGSRVQYEYISGPLDLNKMAMDIASQCDSTVSILDSETATSGDIYAEKSHSVALMMLPAGKDAEVLRENDFKIDRFIKAIEEKVADDYIVIYTSSTPKTPETSSLKKRALADVLSRRAPKASSVNLPVFAKYQLFSPAIFMGLAISLIFVLVVATGVSWLTGIQTPTRFESKPKKQ